MFSWNCLAFSMIQQMLAIWSLVPLHFLKPAWTSGSSQFTYCWKLKFIFYKIFIFHEIISLSLFFNHLDLWKYLQFSCSVMSTLCNPMDCSSPGFPVHHQLPELAQTYFHWVGDAIQPSHPLSSSCPPAFNLSQHQGLFQWVSSAHQVPKYWSFSFSSSPPNEYLGLISFRIDWLNLLAVQEALFSNTQFKSINSSMLSFLYSPTLTSIYDY